jgi:inner membrane protein
MKGTTHIVAGAVTGSIIAKSLNLPIEDTVLLASASAIGSLIPDIDKKNSTIAKPFFFISYPIRKTFGHRTLTHSLFPYLIAFLLINYLDIAYSIYWNGVILGALSHIFLDMLNPTGVALFYPVKKKISFLKIRTGGIFEYIFSVLLVLGYGIYMFI